MSIRQRLGLVEGAGLNDEEICKVLAAMQVASITERISGRFYELTLDGSILVREPADEGVVDLLARLYDEPDGKASDDEAAAAELCVLVPASRSPDFQAARGITGVPGWIFKDLDAAHGALKKAAARVGHTAEPHTLSHLRRASSLSVAVIFGERAKA